MFTARYLLIGVLCVLVDLAYANDPPHVKHESISNIRSPRQRALRETIRNTKRPRNNLVQGLFQSNKPYKQNYLSILQNTPAYGPSEQRWRPLFSYENRNHPALQSLRKAYDLDNAAGAGSEISQIIRLMNWAHKVIPYDGNRSVPAQRNAQNLIELSKKNKAGYDCRGLATILNEAYLAMGFESRLLSCFPKDTADREHHVITMVFSKTLGKWLWMDPSNNAYVTDEAGTLLGPDEVRNRLVKDQPVVINKDANLNNKPITDKQYLYDYMTKNLYWFQTPLHSGFNSETPQVNKSVNYVALFPTGFTPYGSADIRLTTGTAYMTTSSNYFWQKPKGEISLPKRSKTKR